MFIGLLEGYIDDENHLWSTIGGAITGMVGGGLLGSAGAYVERFIAAKKLKNYNFTTNAEYFLLSEELKNQYIKDLKHFYKNYIQGITINKNGHKIYFPKNGAGEQLRWNPKQGKNFPDLINDIKNSPKPRQVPKSDPTEKPNILHYDVYKGKNGEHFVEVYDRDNMSFHITKDTPTRSDRVTNTGASESVLASETNVLNTNNIIPCVAPVVNPAIGDNLNNNEVLKGSVEENVYKDNNNSSNDNEQEPKINPELLKPIELPEETQNTDDGMPTGGAAGIEEPKIPDDIKRESQKYSDPLFMESYFSEVGEYGTLREKFKNDGSFHYNRYEKLEENLPPAERELSRLKRNVEKINETLAEMKEQLEYHEKVVNVYNCPELAEFYLYKPVTNIIGSILEDYCIMEGIDYED